MPSSKKQFLLFRFQTKLHTFVWTHSVSDLGEDDFFDLVHSDNFALVLFVTPGCVKCDEITTQFEQASDQSPKANLVRVDCSTNGKVCDDVGVLHVPEVRLSRGRGRLTVYRGDLDPSAYDNPLSLNKFSTKHLVYSRLLSFIERQHGPAVMELTDANYHEFLSTDYVSIVAFIDDQDKNLVELYSQVAEQLRGEYSFAISHNSSRANDEGVARPGILLLSTFDERRSSYEGPFDHDTLQLFIRKYGTPLIGELHPEVYASFAKTNLPLAQILVASPTERDHLVDLLYPLARRLSSVLTFVTVDLNRYPQRAALLNLADGTKLGFAIENVTSTEKFPLKARSVNAESITDFVQDFVAGKLKPEVRSQPIPVEQQGLCVELVGHTFRETAFDETRDVLVEFYTPWCDYCLESHDVLEELAEHYRDVGLSDKISVAKIDVSNNDVPELITGYPTLKLYPAGGHPPVTFQGNYHEPIPLATLISFIHDHGRNQQEARSLQYSDPSIVSEPMIPLEAGQAELASKSSNKPILSQQHEEL
ncbi:disulfate isomerase [Fusarium subglutinans]|uniref:Protein disulfide-isomerase n=1 Tax=Gibberella subglutinans TaxID=42677 RepID=A0A8H5QC48_GIBSU|nr:disulfate isomerase [Fusarium subglutinans]KAF5611908.1 disulfate isomerase [Fusarium subglutinans]